MDQHESAVSPFDQATTFNEAPSNLSVSELLAIPRKPLAIGKSPDLDNLVDVGSKYRGDVLDVKTTDEYDPYGSRLKDWYQNLQDNNSEASIDTTGMPEPFIPWAETIKIILDHYKTVDPDYLKKEWYVRSIVGYARAFNQGD